MPATVISGINLLSHKSAVLGIRSKFECDGLVIHSDK
jgi:hypothetical protein